MTFKKAEKRNAKLRIALAGPAGSGKTYSALLMARALGGRIAVTDSERGSASKYADLCDFDTCELEDKNPQEYMRVIGEAAAAGYDVLVVDSYSHAWISALEIVDRMGGNKYTNGWKVVSPMLTKLVDAILSFPGHVICTMRSKAEYAVEKDERGKSVPRKIGLAPVVRDGTDYEFDVMLELSVEGGLSVSKTRCSELSGQLYTRDDVVKVAEVLKRWIDQGSPLTPTEALAKRMRFALTLEALQALIPEVGQLPPEERAKLKPVYEARRAALMPEEDVPL